MNRRRIAALIAFPLLVAALVVPILLWRQQIWGLFASTQRLRQWFAGWGIWAPVVFLGIQALQVVVFAIPGEFVQIAGGFLFGGWVGTLLSVAGILIGSTVAFFLARLLGRPFVAALFSKDQVERVERLLASRSARTIFFLLFLIPGIPKDIL
ncbi:MAG TPA: VTT domain-containing protein, partial [Spirochaetia bacterium]|nr:VTT domain-containing protein [Spirochaetia bacterium]